MPLEYFEHKFASQVGLLCSDIYQKGLVGDVEISLVPVNNTP